MVRGGESSLAEQDLAAGAHVLAGLRGALVGARLQADDGLASLQHLFGEVTLALFSGLGAEVRARPLGVPVSLLKQRDLNC